MTIASRIAAFLALVAWTVTATAQSAPALIRNVRGYTLAGSVLVSFDAMAFGDGKVLRTGAAGELEQAYPTARVIDGRGRTLLPGLIDSHGHVLALGYESVQVRLADTATLRDAQRAVRTYARANAQLPWVLGAGWNQERWRLGRFPTATELDAAVADRPVALYRVDGHALWLNSAALRAVAVTRETADPPGGRIERNPDGSPSGVLVDGAMGLAEKLMPPPSGAQRAAALTAALSHLSSVGVTGVADAGASAADVALYRQFADRGALSVRLYVMIRGVGDDFRALSKAGPLIGYAQDHLTVRAVKLFADGALGSRGAAMIEPYSDAPEQRGLLFSTPSDLQRQVETAFAAGYQVNVHAIGDAANRETLDAFEAAYLTAGGRALRNRVEHAQVVAPGDIARFRSLDLIASMQPTHATSDMNMAEQRIGAERLKGAYAWRTFLEQGTVLAFGSDFPVESDNPFFGLHAAINRTDLAGLPTGGWHREQALTRTEAFRAFTIDAAYAQHQESALGTLEPGKWADFILIDHDLFTMPAQDIWKVRVEQTWLGGRRVY